MKTKVRLRKIRKGVYECISVPDKIDVDRIRQIVDREPNQQQNKPSALRPGSAKSETSSD